MPDLDEAVRKLGMYGYGYDGTSRETRLSVDEAAALLAERDSLREERDQYGAALKLLSEQAPLIEQDRDIARQALADVMRDRRAVGERLAAAEARVEVLQAVADAAWRYTRPSFGRASRESWDALRAALAAARPDGGEGGG